MQPHPTTHTTRKVLCLSLIITSSLAGTIIAPWFGMTPYLGFYLGVAALMGCHLRQELAGCRNYRRPGLTSRRTAAAPGPWLTPAAEVFSKPLAVNGKNQVRCVRQEPVLV